MRDFASILARAAALAVFLSSAGPVTATNAGYVYVWQGSNGGQVDTGDFYVVNNTGYQLYISGGISGASVSGVVPIDPYGVYGIPAIDLKQANSGDIRVQVALPSGITHVIDLLAKKVENDYSVWNLTPSGTTFTQTDQPSPDPGGSGACSYGYASSDTSSQYLTPDLVVGLHAMNGGTDSKTVHNTKVILVINPNRSGILYSHCTPLG